MNKFNFRAAKLENSLSKAYQNLAKYMAEKEMLYLVYYITSKNYLHDVKKLK